MMTCRPGLDFVIDEETLLVDGKKYKFGETSPDCERPRERLTTRIGGQLTLLETYKWRSSWKRIRNK